MTDLLRRIIRLEAHHQVTSTSAEDAAKYARYEGRMVDLSAFVRAAFPESNECVAHYVALILGLPDSPAMRAHLKGQPLEAIARDRYGANWRSELEATAAEAAAHCQTAHGPTWPATLAAIWAGGENRE